VAGQRAVSAWRTALLTCRGRAAAAVCSPAEPDGPSGTDDTGPSPARRPRSVVTTSLSSPMVGHHAGNLPRAHLGDTGRTCSFSCSPANRPASWRWTSSLAGHGAAACARAMRRPRSAVDPRASHPRPTQHHPFPSGPMRAGDHAARGPRRHVEPIAPNEDGPPHRAIPGSSPVRTARLQSHGHRRPVRPDTWMAPVAWTPDAWTPDVRVTDRTDVRLTDRTDVRTADRGRGQATTGVAGVRTSSRPATTRWAARPRPDPSVWGRLATHDGSAATTPAPRPWPPPLNNCPAPPSTPRLGALLSCVGVGGYEGRAMGLRKGEGVLGQACKGVLMGCRDSR
jgi:hypothetical protein